MKRIFAALTLLLYEFLVMHLGHYVLNHGTIWLLILSAIVVVLFLGKSRIAARLVEPTPGLQLLTAGVVLYVLLMLLTSSVIAGLAHLPAQAVGIFTLVVTVALAPYMVGIKSVAIALMLLGVFRLFANLTVSDRSLEQQA